MNSFLKGYFRRVVKILGQFPCGKFSYEHKLELSCGHVAFRRGGVHARFSGVYCHECASGSQLSWGLQ